MPDDKPKRDYNPDDEGSNWEDQRKSEPSRFRRPGRSAAQRINKALKDKKKK